MIDRSLRWYDYVTVNIFFLGLTTLSQTNGLAFPLLVQQFVGDQAKGSYLGNLRLWTLMMALLTQGVWGILSDRCTLRWGRRRPFIFTGTLLALIFIAAIAFSTGMSGVSGFWFLFAMAILLSGSTNMAQAAQQGLIPDLVPEDRRGRFSGIKAVLELPLPLILISFTVAKLIGGGRLSLGLLVVMGVLAASMLIALRVPERPLAAVPSSFDWAAVLRLAIMTGFFTATILGAGALISAVGRLLAGVRSPATLLAVLGTAGLLAMAAAVGFGVWASVRIGIGREATRRSSSFTWWVINRLAFLAAVGNISTFAIYFVQGRLGYARENAAGPASRLMMVVGIFVLLTALPSGWLTDRCERRLLLLISGLVAVLGTLVAIVATNMQAIYVAGCLIGAASGLFYTVNWALGTDLVPAAEAGRYLGISNLAGAGAGAVGAYIGGPIADYITIHVPQVPGLGYVLIFAIYGGLLLLSIAALAGVRVPALPTASDADNRAVSAAM